MKKYFLASVITGMLLGSCNSSDSSADTSTAFDSSLSKSATPANASPVVNNTVVQQDSTAVQQIPGQPGVTVQAPPVATAPTGAGLNPAHGQPGHRCDIAVGAPLNSAPANTTTNVTTPVSSSTPVTSQPAITTSTQKTAPGMNPPHGQPGHRCDISVGAPLNSPAAKPVTTVQPATNQKPAAAITPVVSEQVKDSSGK